MTTRDLVVAIKSKWDGKGTNDAAKGLEQTEKASRKFTAELDRMEKQARQQAAAMKQSTAAAAQFGGELDDVGRTAIKTRRLLEDATKRLPKIDVEADMSEPERQLAALSARLQELSGKRIAVDIDAREAANETERIRRELIELALLNPEIVVGANVERAIRDLDRAEREARDLDRRVTIEVDVDGAAASAAQIGLIQAALTAVRTAAPATSAAATAALAALPVVASVAASGIAVILGGALAGIGLAAAHGSDEAQDAIGHLREVATREAKLIGKPFEQVWTTIVRVAERELLELSPVVRRALGNLAPDVEDFVERAGDSLSELAPAIDSVERAFSAVLRDLGPHMPEIMRHISEGITAVTDAVAENPEAISRLARDLAFVAKVTGDLVGWLTRLGETMNKIFPSGVTMIREMTSGMSSSLDAAVQASRDASLGVQRFAESSDEASKKVQEAWGAAHQSFIQLSGALSSAREHAADQQALAQAQQSVAQAQARAAEVQRQGAERIARAERELADAHEQGAERIAAAKARVKDAQREAAEAAEDAQARIRDAQDAVTRAVEEGAQREAAAQRQVEDARERLADVAEDAGRRIADAEQRLADASADAAARQVDAERRVQDAHRRTEEAVEDLTAARERAQERLEDLIAAESGAALDEEGAQLAIERARQRMEEINADPKATDLDRREADLAYREALARLEDVRRRNAELREDLADAQQRGIDGSTEVVDAIGRIEDARRAETEAEQAAARQREESARQIADAEQALADAHRDAARQRQDAEQALVDALAELDRTRAENARQVADAQRQVAEAQEDAAQSAKESARTVAEAQAEAARAVRDASREIADAEQQVRDARKQAAQDTRDANESVLESWARLRGDSKLTTTELLAQLEQQVRDQEEWRKNLVELAGRVPDEMLDELAKLGPGGAEVVRLASEMSQPELDRFVALHGRSGKAAGEVFAANLDEAGPILREIARQRGQEVADKVREGMDGGRHSVFEAAKRVGLEVTKGVGSDRQVKITVDTSEADATMNAWLIKYSAQISAHYADGGINGGSVSFAGGVEQHVAQIGAGMTRVWNEPETGGEAYIPLSPNKRGRSELILAQVADMFGGQYVRPAAGMSTGGGWYGGGGGGGGNSYNITVQVAPNANMADVGAVTVRAIQEYERRSGSAWRRSN